MPLRSRLRLDDGNPLAAAFSDVGMNRVGPGPTLPGRVSDPFLDTKGQRKSALIGILRWTGTRPLR